jgi:ABC-type dipeptide/oligopeptide/nickel transport system ATPase component
VTSALDTVVGAAILELMAELRRQLNRLVPVHQS